MGGRWGRAGEVTPRCQGRPELRGWVGVRPRPGAARCPPPGGSRGLCLSVCNTTAKRRGRRISNAVIILRGKSLHREGNICAYCNSY